MGMVRGMGGAGDFVRIRGKLEQVQNLNIFKRYLLPSIRQRVPNEGAKFVLDNSPIHKERSITAWFFRGQLKQ